MYAADWSWWAAHTPEFGGRKWSCSAEIQGTDINYIPYKKGVGVGDGFVYTGYGNSGFQALNLALQWGHDPIYLIGFDMKYRGSEKHWHPDHRGNNPSPQQLIQWATGFDQLPMEAKKRVRVVGDSALIGTFQTAPLVPPCEGVIAVLRSGGWCGPEHAERLSQAVVSRGKRFLCLTDMEPDCERLPLRHGWPGWWSKFEVCRPDISGDWLYMDLDTMVFGDLDPLLEFGRFGMLGDYYRPILESGVMFLPEHTRRAIWAKWSESPDEWMKKYRGDGAFLRDHFPAARLQDHIPGLHSYKVDGLRDDTRLLVFHGSPRPHETEHWR